MWRWAVAVVKEPVATASVISAAPPIWVPAAPVGAAVGARVAAYSYALARSSLSGDAVTNDTAIGGTGGRGGVSAFGGGPGGNGGEGGSAHGGGLYASSGER